MTQPLTSISIVQDGMTTKRGDSSRATRLKEELSTH